MAKSTKKKSKKLTEDQLKKARQRLTELSATIVEAADERDALRHKIADYFLPEKEKDHGSKTVKLFGIAVTVGRKKYVSCNKEQQQAFSEEDPKLFKKIFPKKTVRVMDETLARKSLKDIDTFVTTKQGLPEIKFKDIEDED